MLDTRIAAFVEYVARPLVADIRGIVDEFKTLNVAVSEAMLLKIAIALGLWHITGEVIRALCYVAITWIICGTFIQVW